MEINKKLLVDIEAYCVSNKILDVNDFINRLLSERFMEVKYGYPNGFENNVDETTNNKIPEEIKQTEVDKEDIYDES